MLNIFTIKTFYMSEGIKETKTNSSDDLKWLELVIQHVGSLRYGVVEIVIHDSRVIQIEKTERVRLEKPPAQKE